MRKPKTDNEALTALHEHALNVPKRTIYLFGDIDDESAATFIKNFTYLTGAADEPIVIELMSPGGSVDAGMAIYDTITAATAGGVDVFCKVRGEASSIACVILQACSKRFVFKNATVMHHRGTVPTGEGSPEEQSTVAAYNNRQFDDIDEMVYNRVRYAYGGSLRKFRLDTTKAICMTGTEAVEAGFADFAL